MELSYGCQEVQQFTTSKKFAVRILRIVRAQERRPEARWWKPQGWRAQAFRLEPRQRTSLVERQEIVPPQKQQPELVVRAEARRA